MRTAPLFRHSRSDAALALAALCQGAAVAALLRAAPGVAAALGLGVGLWWASNTLSHNHLHNPLFRARWLNGLFSLYLSVLLGVPQTIWRRRHLWHHGGERPRGSSRPLPLGALGALEVAAVAALFLALLCLAPRLFLTVYLPGYALGLLLCQLQGHFEHARDGGRDLRGVSYYGALYNLLWFNDGYHAEHHRYPGEHWSRLPARREAVAPRAPAPSAQPPLLRWLDGGLQGVALGWLERLALRPGWVQRFVLRSHERALAALLPRLPRPPRRVLIVGGGLFPRTARALRRLLPEAELTLLDRDPAHLALARRQLGEEAAERLRFRCASFTGPGDEGDADLVVVPLAFVGDRAALYREGGPPRLVHDWLWRARGRAGVVVSPFLLKRLNLVAP